MESVMKTSDTPGWFVVHAAVRTDSYVMLASLLGQPPSEERLNIVRNLHWDEALPETLDHALAALRQAADDHPLDALKDEFNKLFVGLGSGELVPYASWYRGKKIQSSPLASLRSDFIELGIVRQEGCHESEDHAGTLCEIMAIISQKGNDIPTAEQATFFYRHIAPWMMTFFTDLQSAKSAEFYRMVGLFGSCFLEIESQYLNQKEECQMNRELSGNRRTFFKHAALFGWLTVLLTMGRPAVAKPEKPLPEPEPPAQGYRFTEHVKKYYETART
jgi:TorA maturation chaperone TorD